MERSEIGIFLVLILGLSLAVGCVGFAPSGQVDLSATPLAPLPLTPVPAPVVVTAAAPTELAVIQSQGAGLNPGTGYVFEYPGNIEVVNGVYNSVEIVIRYSNGNEYRFDAGGMGGANLTLKPYDIFPPPSYLGQYPENFIILDGMRYSTIHQYTNGADWWVATSGTLVGPDRVPLQSS
jgi:hypothetical protein